MRRLANGCLDRACRTQFILDALPCPACCFMRSQAIGSIGSKE